MTSRFAVPGLVPLALRKLPLGAVLPGGWLAEQLRLQATGLTGVLDEIWTDVSTSSAWIGGPGEDWERGPYYVDGLVPLAHLLGDHRLQAKAGRWIDWMLASQREDGQFGPCSNDDWWPRMVALKALAQHHEATGDPRVLAAMTGYFRYQLGQLPIRPLGEWGRVRGADNVLSVYWLYERTGDGFLLDLADLLLSQTVDWGTYLRAFPCTEVSRIWDPMTHAVNVAMGLKTPAVRSRRDAGPDHRRVTNEALANLDRYHGQVHGMFSGDEWLAGPEATRGIELCAVVEMMYTLEQLLGIYGCAEYGDRLEGLAYNLLPAALTADMTAHQYLQQANQVLATIDQREWTDAQDDCTIFGLAPTFGCCTANLHQGWPKFVASLWMETDDGGLAAPAYGPSSVRWVSDSRAVGIECTTDYPFDDTVTFRIVLEAPASFPLWLRAPAWCPSPQVVVNGASCRSAPSGCWLRLERSWADGDCVVLRLPMTVRSVARARGALGVALGPLLLAFSPGEIWPRLPGSGGFGDWEVRPRRSWSMALAVSEEDMSERVRVERLGPTSPPYGLRTGAPPLGVEDVPLRVWVPGRRLPSWLLEHNSAAPPPQGPVEASGPSYPVPLVPYGCARLRVAEFATIRPSPVKRGGPD